MKIGILGTGSVARAIAGKLAELGHEVAMGTRDPARTLAATEPSATGAPPFGAWRKGHAAIPLGTFAAAAAHGEVVVNATRGDASLEALRAAGAANLDGKVLIDVSNPLDFSHGRPPGLFVKDSDSLGEQIQRAFPGARVVKTLHTVNALLMVNPRAVAKGGHTVFVSGNDAAAKATVTSLLRSFGWSDVLDLGDITTARGTEMYLPLWLRAWGAVKTPMFNVKVVR